MLKTDTLYENIKKYRKEKKFSQDELAQLAGYKSNSMIAQIENGLVDLSFSKIISFSEILGVPVTVLIGLAEADDMTARMERLPDNWKQYMNLQLKFAETNAATETDIATK